MRKIIVAEFLTLDGVMQAPGGSKEDENEGFQYGGWMGPFFDDTGGKIMEKQMEGRSDLLLGRKTYEIFAGYWPEHETSWPGINDVTKYVVSTSLAKPAWKNTVVINSIDAVKELKQQKGSDLQIWGSSKLVQSLLKHDLVDELWLKFFPIILGTGKRLFEPGSAPGAYKLTESQSTPSGVIFANYVRDGAVKTATVGA